MAQWKRIRLVTMRTQVRSLALLSGLGIQCCHELLQTWLRSHVAVADSTPSLGTSICHGCSPKKKKKKKNRRRRRKPLSEYENMEAERRGCFQKVGVAIAWATCF